MNPDSAAVGPASSGLRWDERVSVGPSRRTDAEVGARAVERSIAVKSESAAASQKRESANAGAESIGASGPAGRAHDVGERDRPNTSERIKKSYRHRHRRRVIAFRAKKSCGRPMLRDRVLSRAITPSSFAGVTAFVTEGSSAGSVHGSSS